MTIGLDLDFDDGQLAIADALAQFCAEQCDEDTLKAAAGTLPRDLWGALAELGVLAAGDVGDEGGALEVCAAMESLGRGVFPGPLATSFLARGVLPEAEREALERGELIVSLGSGALFPFAAEADVLLELGTGGSVHRCRALGEIQPVETLGGEPWGRLETERVETFSGAERSIALMEMARAAQLAALGERLVADTAEHTRTRQQFGRPIGDFQAVAHPLADCHIRLVASRSLARRAAWLIDHGALDLAPGAAAAARLSAATAAVETANVSHQLFGAVGITLEGPVFHISRRIRQLASQAPSGELARAHLLTRIGLGPQAAAAGSTA